MNLILSVFALYLTDLECNIKFSKEISSTHETRQYDEKSLTFETLHSGGISRDTINTVLSIWNRVWMSKKVVFRGSELVGKLT